MFPFKIRGSMVGKLIALFMRDFFYFIYVLELLCWGVVPNEGNYVIVPGEQ